MHRLWLPDPAEVVAIHDEILRRTGGERGVLAQGGIASAIARARRGHLGRATSLVERAAFLLRGVAQDHPFADGNKRTAFEVADLFLRENGHLVTATQAEIEVFMVWVAGGEDATLEAIAEWLQPRLQRQNVYDVPAPTGAACATKTSTPG